MRILTPLMPSGFAYRHVEGNPEAEQHNGGQIFPISSRWANKVDDVYYDPSGLGLVFKFYRHGASKKTDIILVLATAPKG